MRILADENIDRPIVQWLREQGHDVAEVIAVAPGMADELVVHMSRRDNRVLITLDVGRILLADRAVHPGVVYLRLQGKGPELWETFKRVWPSIEPVVAGHLVTARNHQIRRRPLPLDLET